MLKLFSTVPLNMFKIGDFSKLTHVSVRMLRYYDETGLLKPDVVDKFTSYRFYSAKQISRLSRIVSLRDMGFLIAEISEILEEDCDNQKLHQKLEQKKLNILNTITFENEKLQKLERMIKSIETESVSMNYEVTIKSVPSYKVVSLREIIPAYNMEGMLWQKLGEFMENEKIKCPVTNPCFAIYHDGEHKESGVDVEVVMSVDELLRDKGEFKFRETEPVSSMASLMVPGSFDNLQAAYNALAEWIEKNNYKITGQSRQVCHKGPWNENSIENYLTEIQMPVEKM